jgi:hypothetical protein
MRREEFLAEIQYLTAQPALKAAVESRAAFRAPATLNEDELCRQAILRIGTEEQFGSSSHALLLAKSLYPQVRDALLLAGSWTWAMETTTVIETLPRPEYKWAYCYPVPGDCLRVFRVNDWDAATADSAWEILGNHIYTNADSGSPAWTVDRVYKVGNAVSHKGAVYKCMVAGTAKEPGVTAGWQSDWDVHLGSAITLEYVRKVTDVTLFDSLFVDLLTANLAAKLAVPLTGDANKAALLAKETEVLFKNPAMRRDSTERKPKIKPAWASSKLVSSRSGGDGIEASKATGGGPAGGVSYPSLQVTVGSVTSVPNGTPPIVTNTGQYDTAVLNFGLPEGPVGPANTLSIGTVTTGAAGSPAGATITGTAPNQTLSLDIPQGIKGDKGDAATIAVGTVSTLPEGSAATVANTGTTGDAVFDFEIPQGAAGTIAVGNVTTGAAGSQATITNTGTTSNAVLDFEIPKGDKGDAATIAAGAVTTGVAGSSASVTNVGTANDAIFNFVIPRGDAGLGNAFYSLTPPAAPSAGDFWWKTDKKQLFLFNGTNWTEINGNNDEFPVFDADADTYIASVEAADGQALEQAVKDAYTMFIVNAKLDGIWNSIKASCIMAGARTLDGALTPLAGVAPTNNNFTPADYNRKTGILGDGTNKYLNTNRLNAAEPIHVAIYITQKGTLNSRYLLGGTAVSGGTMLLQASATSIQTRQNSGTTITTSAHAVGLMALNRATSTDYTVRNNGTDFTVAQASVTPSAHTLNLFAGTGGTTKSNPRLSFYSIGEGIDLSKLDSRVTNLMSQLNAAIS